jgi:hypothetical protein
MFLRRREKILDRRRIRLFDRTNEAVLRIARLIGRQNGT